MKQTAIRAALAASKIIKENYGKINHSQIDTKKQFDFVTFVDKTSEKIIIETILKEHPDHHFYAEESYKEGPGGYRWIIDPLDGTTNYIHGIPYFAISIALEYQNEIILGVIYDPMRDELFVAEKNKGVTLNGKSVSVSQISAPEYSVFATGFPFKLKGQLDQYLDSFKQLFMQVSGIRRMGAVALDYAHLACGRYEGFWEFGLSPWDIAAGYILIKEAGGLMTDFWGGENPVWNGYVVASNGKMHDTILSVVKNVFPQPNV